MKKLNGSSYTWEDTPVCREIPKKQHRQIRRRLHEPESDWIAMTAVVAAIIIVVATFLILVIQHTVLKPLWLAIDTIEAYTAEIASYQRRLPLLTPTPTPEPTEAPAEDPGLTLPDPEIADGSFKTYLDYRHITKKDSAQYQLQQLAWSDTKGFRRYGRYYLVALGMAYTNTIGETFEIALSSGKTVACMVGDVKHPDDTDPSNRYVPVNGNIVEFIIDEKNMSPEVLSGGDISPLGFQGSVTRIQPTGYKEVTP